MDDSHSDSLHPKYRRVILKLSGESFSPAGKRGTNIDETLNIAHQAKRVHGRGVQLAIVVGAGNILRGAQFSAGGTVIREATAHYLGMVATILNGLALPARPPLEKNRIVILAGGTGNPFVTTDTAAALRARELEANILLKATKVDGVYSEDPEVNPHAGRYEKLTYSQVLRDNLHVMDMAR